MAIRRRRVVRLSSRESRILILASPKWNCALTSLAGFGGPLWRRCCCFLSPAVAVGLSCFSTVAGVSTAAVVAHWMPIAAGTTERSPWRSSCQVGSPAASLFSRVSQSGTALAPRELAAGSFVPAPAQASERLALWRTRFCCDLVRVPAAR